MPVSTLFFLFLLILRNSLHISDTKHLLVLGITSIFFKLMAVKNCEGSKTVPYLQDSHSIMGTDKDKKNLNKTEGCYSQPNSKQEE